MALQTSMLSDVVLGLEDFSAEAQKEQQQYNKRTIFPYR